MITQYRILGFEKDTPLTFVVERLTPLAMPDYQSNELWLWWAEFLSLSEAMRCFPEAEVLASFPKPSAQPELL